jgi:hypothetical protein
MESLFMKAKLAWIWIKTHPKAAASAALSFLVALLWWKFKMGRQASLSDAITVRKETKVIAEKQGRATQLYIQGMAKSKESKQLEAEIADSKRRVLEIQKGESLGGKSDDEVARMFTNSGF